ncbi:hypothetical protein [Streptomyces sp. WP-1]|uniref:hypothetical protein n=1 Tax=Streptomyces sp. WP-1 TaxID=3041497 RepID=UPI002649E14F|nr:hypothetical protein [Streptomyces sp. WP-1]WKE69070.1 hypothetical protein QHG49_08540 [Streptomyces sp. WP-1]
MPLPPHPGIFVTVERNCADSDPTPRLRLREETEELAVPLSLPQARQALYDRSMRPAVRSDLWRQIAERRRLGDDGVGWPLAVVWLGLPGLRRSAFRIARSCRADRGEVEAELVTCYLEALDGVEAYSSDPGGQVLRSACSRAWALWRAARAETVVDDVETSRRAPVEWDAEGPWEMYDDPPEGSFGFSAPVRIAVPAHRVEGVRLGALAQTWNMAGTAKGARYQDRGRQVAKISLRRVGRKG